MAKLTEKITALRAKLQALETEKKAQERVSRQADRQKERKAENQRKFELGGLCKLAGLFDFDRGALLGALLTLLPLLSDANRFAEFKRAGDALMERRERERATAKNRDVSDESYLQ